MERYAWLGTIFSIISLIIAYQGKFLISIAFLLFSTYWFFRYQVVKYKIEEKNKI
jgi:hypothetical protein